MKEYGNKNIEYDVIQQNWMYQRKDDTNQYLQTE